MDLALKKQIILEHWLLQLCFKHMYNFHVIILQSEVSHLMLESFPVMLHVSDLLQENKQLEMCKFYQHEN